MMEWNKEMGVGRNGCENGQPVIRVTWHAMWYITIYNSLEGLSYCKIPSCQVTIDSVFFFSLL